MKKCRALIAPLALAVAAIPATSAADDTGQEIDFQVSVPEGWVIEGQSGGHFPKTVLVPAGESLESAAVSITIIHYQGFGSMLGPQEAIDRARERLLKACPAIKVSESRFSGKGPDERSFARLDCNAPGPNAKPISVFAAARREQTTLRLTSIAYKRQPSAEETRFALSYLGEAGI